RDQVPQTIRRIIPSDSILIGIHLEPIRIMLSDGRHFPLSDLASLCYVNDRTKFSMAPTCPNCGSVIYSRRNALCGVCGQRLPAELLFTPEERQRVERDLSEAKRRAKRTHLSQNEASTDPSPPFLLDSTDF